jgi:hypothetical protein
MCCTQRQNISIADRQLQAIITAMNVMAAWCMLTLYVVDVPPAGMAARGLSPSGAGVYFGQLLGMSDNLTFTLGQHGYEAFKYVPYG